jgi:hypothetical protein
LTSYAATALTKLRLDAVDDLMNHTSFTSDFRKFAKELPDLEVSSCDEKPHEHQLIHLI